MDYTKTINDLEAIKGEWLKNVEHIDSTISLLKRVNATGATAIPSISTQTDKKPDTAPVQLAPPPLRKITKAEKIINTIIDLGRFATRNEIERDGGFDNNIAANLSTNDKVINYKDGKNSYWGLTEWADENGKPKSDYLPNKKVTNVFF